MEMGMTLNENLNGINYKDRTYMVAGYIKDYKPIIADPVGDVDPESKIEKTYADFTNERGYVDNDGHIWIYLKNPKRGEPVPWFTVVIDDELNPKIKYDPRGHSAEELNIGRVGDLSIKAIVESTTNKPIDRDPEVLQAIARSQSRIAPEISKEDDFLKKIIKKTIIEKNVDINKYKPIVDKAWVLSNLSTALMKNTKISTKAFLEWMELLDCDFEITVKDNGHDKDDPLVWDIKYDSTTDQVHAVDRKTGLNVYHDGSTQALIEGGNQGELEDKQMAKSVKA